MRIALTYNEKRSSDEAEAEFDTPETIAALSRIVGSLGHMVTPIEVGAPVDDVVRSLRAASPDLVFNIAEGRRGKFREAFFPALFEQLELRHTGSCASTLALCLDKALSCRVVAAAGVPVPRGQLVRDLAQLRAMPLTLIVKPNYEGSSKGITQASVVTEASALRDTVAEALRWGDVLVEEYIDGDDVSVGWIDGIGMLPPIRYWYEPIGRHRIYEYALKKSAELVRTEIFSNARLLALARRAFEALGVTSYGRADFRMAGDDIYFLEMNPLPTLAPDDPDLYMAAEKLGKSPRDVLAAILAN